MDITNSLFNILYIEDNFHDAFFATDYFKSYPYFKLEIARSGKQGLELIKKNKYDVLILDNFLTDMKGMDILKILSSQSNNLPVIMLTGSSEEEEVIQALRMGARDYIFKNDDYLPKLPVIVKKIIEESKEKKHIINNNIRVLYLSKSSISQQRIYKFLSETSPHINLTMIDNNDTLIDILEKDKSFDILLINLFSNDTTTLSLIKELNFRGINIPFIILAEQGNEELSVESFRLGASDYIRTSENFLTLLPNTIERTFLQVNLKKSYQIQYEQEKELFSIQQRLRELAEYSGLVYWIRDTATNKITYVSPSYEDFTELSCESLYNNLWSWYELVPADEVEFMMKKLKNRDDSIIEFTHRIITPSGKTKWVKSESHPVKDNNGKVIRVIGTVKDITQFKNTENSLIETSEKLNFLISSTPAIIYSSTDLANLGATFISNNVYEVLGYKSEELINNPTFWFDHTHPDDREEIFYRQPSKYQEELQVYEYRFLHSNGTYKWIHSEIRLLQNENTGTIESIGYLIDITGRKLVEEELKVKEFNASLIYNSTSDLMCLISVKGKNNFIYTSINKSYLDGMKIFVETLTEEDIIGKDVKFVINNFLKKDEVAVQFVFDKYNEAIKTGKTIEYEEELDVSFGKFYLETSLTPIFNKYNVCTHLLYVSKNVTEKRLGEEKLRESEERFRNSFDHAAIGMAIMDIDKRFLQVNNSLCKMLGYSQEELLNKSFSCITYHDDLDLSINITKNLLNGSSQAINFEKRYLHKSGDIIWVNINTTLNRDRYGNPDYFISQIENITERKKSEEKLKEQAELLDITTDAICVIDMSHNIIFWNKGAEKLYNYKKEEIIGKNIVESIYDSSPDKFIEVLGMFLKSKQWQGESEHVDKDGNKIIVDSKWTLMNDNNGAPLSILIVNTDITQKKYLEKEYFRTQRLESIGTLAGGIAHDLNNILTPILMGAEILKNNISEEKKQKVVKNIGSSARQGAELIKRILMFSRGDEPNFQKININDLLKGINEIIRDTFPKSINIEINSDESILKIMGDNTQLNQLFMNLCINARDAMPNGGKLTIQVENTFIDKSYAYNNMEIKLGNYVLVRVDDTGIGIPKEYIEKIFEPFFTTKEISKATGLGLSTCHLIIKNHKAFMNVYSEVDKGTSFKIYLPAFIEKQDSIDSYLIEPEQSLTLGSGQLILVVDDETGIREIITEILEASGYRVILADNGPEAINLYAQNKNEIKAVLMDINMPLMDGVSVMKVLNKIDSNIRIIGMSGLSSNIELIKDLTDYFLEKPFTAQKLLKLISNLNI